MKKGFTLVELLAVIAILAILVIVAVPNTIRLFNDAKKKTFLTEVATLYKEAQKKYINESVKGNNIKNISSIGDNKLDISGEKMDYCITLDSKGNIVSMKVSNDDYYIIYGGTNIEDLEITDIMEGTIDASTCTVKPLDCTYNGELVQGATYKNGQYTYVYRQKGTHNGYVDIDEDGWGVKLTDSDSTKPVTTRLCSSINEKPIVAMSYMFYKSKAPSIDLSSFDTSHVNNMHSMFDQSSATNLDMSTFDTSNVTDMGYMFYESKATSIELSNLVTSNVTNMDRMFGSTHATVLDLSNFDTRKVTNMSDMFAYAYTETLDLSSFDTHNVTKMNSGYCNKYSNTIAGFFYGFFAKSKVKNIIFGDNFSLDNVDSLSCMFYGTSMEYLDLTALDTTNVTDMGCMFHESLIETLDLSSFNTKNVTEMSGMFREASNLKTVYVSDLWNTSKVTSDTSMHMFYSTNSIIGANGTIFNRNYTSKSYARVDKPGIPGYFTYKAHN